MTFIFSRFFRYFRVFLISMCLSLSAVSGHAQSLTGLDSTTETEQSVNINA